MYRLNERLYSYNARYTLRVPDVNRLFDPQLKLGDAILQFLNGKQNTVNLGQVKDAIREAGDL